MACNKRSGERAPSRFLPLLVPKIFSVALKDIESLQPRSKGSLLPVYGAREMGREREPENEVGKPLDGDVLHQKRTIYFEVFPKQTDEMWCIEQPRKKAGRLG